jgi:hypothetical protein
MPLLKFRDWIWLAGGCWEILSTSPFKSGISWISQHLFKCDVSLFIVWNIQYYFCVYFMSLFSHEFYFGIRVRLHAHLWELLKCCVRWDSHSLRTIWRKHQEKSIVVKEVIVVQRDNFLLLLHMVVSHC